MSILNDDYMNSNYKYKLPFIINNNQDNDEISFNKKTPIVTKTPSKQTRSRIRVYWNDCKIKECPLCISKDTIKYEKDIWVNRLIFCFNTINKNLNEDYVSLTYLYQFIDFHSKQLFSERKLLKYKNCNKKNLERRIHDSLCHNKFIFKNGKRDKKKNGWWQLTNHNNNYCNKNI